MAGSPKKRAKREAQEAIASGVIPVPKTPPGPLPARKPTHHIDDPAWVERAWVAYLANPSVTALSQAMGCSGRTASTLIKMGGKGSIPFAARLHAITVAKNVETVDDDAAALKESLRGLAKVARSQTRLADAFDRDTSAAADKATPAILMAAEAPPKELKALTDGLAKSAEVFQALTQGQKIGTNALEDALASSTDANSALASVLSIIAKRAAPRG